MNLISENNLKLISDIIEPIWLVICTNMPNGRIDHYSGLTSCQKVIFTDAINPIDIDNESQKLNEQPSYMFIKQLSRIKYYTVPFLLSVFRISPYIHRELRSSCIFSSSDHNEVESYKHKIDKYISESKHDATIVSKWKIFSKLFNIKKDVIEAYVYEFTSIHSKATFFVQFCIDNDEDDLDSFLHVLENKGENLQDMIKSIRDNFKNFPLLIGSFEYYLFIETIKPHINYILRILNLEQKIYINYIVGKRLSDRQMFTILMKYIRSIDYVSKHQLEIIY